MIQQGVCSSHIHRETRDGERTSYGVGWEEDRRYARRLLTAGKKARAPSSRCSSQRRLLPCSAHEGDLVSCFLRPGALLGAVGELSGHQLTRLKLMLGFLRTRQAQKNSYNSCLTEDETWLLKSTHSSSSQEDFIPTLTTSKQAEPYRPESTLGSSGGRIRLASAAHWFRSAAAAPSRQPQQDVMQRICSTLTAPLRTQSTRMLSHL